MPIPLTTLKPSRFYPNILGFRLSLWRHKYVYYSGLILLAVCQAIVFFASGRVQMILTRNEYDWAGSLCFIAALFLIVWAGRRVQLIGKRHAALSSQFSELKQYADFGRANANLIHEIANPLTAAFLTLELMRPKNTSHVQLAYSHLQQVQRYLEAVREDLGGNRLGVAFNCREEIEKVLSSVNHRADIVDVSLTFQAPADCQLTGSPVKFSQIVSNLITNAIDSYLEFPEATIKSVIIKLTSTVEHVVFSVTDFGCGLTKAQLSDAFKPFYSTKSQRFQNLGLGLATVKQFVEVDFSGRITVKSRPTRGTTCTVYFPKLP